jgi:phosphate transport system protein
MSRILQREIDKLKKTVLSLGTRVEETVRRAVNAIDRRDIALAQHVIEHDEDIDHAEIEVEEECLKILALHQPVAVDLRFVVSCMKINNDLERIGDRAASIAECGLALARSVRVDIPFDFVGMADKVQNMLKLSIDALVNFDDDLARSVCAMDDDVDAIHRGMYNLVKDAIRDQPSGLDGFVRLLTVSRHLERIADHATNIAEDVLYMLSGEIVRHGHGRLSRDDGEHPAD